MKTRIGSKRRVGVCVVWVCVGGGGGGGG
eukprot:COSAG04_NODE_3287_length_2971_cov_10.541086_6_plen_28_part_01